MRQSNAQQTQKFRGTVAELADKIEHNGGVLSMQDVQFLTRIGNGTFAKKVGTKAGSGSRGGKRAIIWEINPSARIVLGMADTSTPAAPVSKPAATKKSANDAQSALITAAVNDAVAKVVAAKSGTGKRGRPRKAVQVD